MIIRPGKAVSMMHQPARPVDHLAVLGEFSAAGRTVSILLGVSVQKWLSFSLLLEERAARLIKARQAASRKVGNSGLE